MLLFAFGFSPRLLTLFQSYLFSRKQFVEYRGYKSNVFYPTSGVPQGSNLGPLLFLIFINDVVNCLHCETLLFADDMKLFYRIDSYDDCMMMQDDLCSLNSWCLTNRLILNIAKCKVMTYTRKHTAIAYEYSICNTVLDRVNSVKDLGITFDRKLNFIEQVNGMIANAYRSYGFIYRNCKDFTNVKCLLLLYFSFVRSKLEYGAIVWYPIYNIHSSNIERVQRKFLKYIMFVSDGVYPERGYCYNVMLERFNLMSLESRRFVHSIKFLYNVLQDKIDCIWIVNRINFNIPRITSRYKMTFYIDKARSNMMYRSPISIMCNNFNLICASCDINFSSFSDILGIIRNM